MSCDQPISVTEVVQTISVTEVVQPISVTEVVQPISVLSASENHFHFNAVPMIGTKQIVVSGVSEHDLLQFKDDAWRNTPAADLVDGGNF
jgi:hypothetical protein